MQIKKWEKIIVFCFASIILISAIFEWTRKITDPLHARFDILKFDLWDYGVHRAEKPLRILLDPGMTRGEIENLLVNIAKTRYVQATHRDDFGYALNTDENFQRYRKEASSLALYQRGGRRSKSGAYRIYVFYDAGEQAQAIFYNNELLEEKLEAESVIPKDAWRLHTK